MRDAILLRSDYFLFLAWFLTACGTLGAGSHAYCESILLNCPSDTVIENLSLLKATGRYNDARSFSDGREPKDTEYGFYFYDQKHNVLVRIEVPLHTPKNTDLHLAAIKDFRSSNKWEGFNDKLSDEKKAEVLSWFNNSVRPTLTCSKSIAHVKNYPNHIL